MTAVELSSVFRPRVGLILGPGAVYGPGVLHELAQALAAAGAKANLGVVLGTERVVDDALLISVLVTNRDGTIAGFQDKVQIDPSEEGTYSPGSARRVFQTGPLTFGVVSCHEGWRYPETVRWAARRGAQIVFHPHFHKAESGGYRPVSFADPANSFHEKAALCRAAENTCYFATVKCQRWVADDLSGRAARQDAA